MVPVTTTMQHDGKQITLISPVGRILRIETIDGQEPRALVNLFYYMSALPSFPFPIALAPPNRTYLQIPSEVVWSNYVQWLPKVMLQSEAFVFLHQDYSTGPAGFSLGMENFCYCSGFLETSPTRPERMPGLS
jgi:hypothetical protein